MNSEKIKVEGLLLESLWDLIYRAHSWTSFSPDKRATQYVTEYSQILKEDLAALGEKAGNYQEKFISHFTSWMNAKSNCASSAITGGSNFNVRRAEKMNSREHAKNVEFFNFREKYFKAVNRQRTLSPEEELDLAQAKLDKLSNLQSMMKDANAILRKMKFAELSKDEIEQKITYVLNGEDFPEDVIKEVISNGNLGYGYSFPSFSLTNNNAKIKGAQSKITAMKSRIERKQTFEAIKFEGGYLTIEDDRVKIFHDSKPEQAVIDELKKSGFRWSPFWKCWCRKHTGNAIGVATNLSFIKN